MTNLLIFSIVGIKLDIIYLTILMNRFTENYTHQYIKVVKTIFQYSKNPVIIE